MKISLPRNYNSLEIEDKIDALNNLISRAQNEIAKLEDELENDGLTEEERFDEAMDLLYPNAETDEEREEVLFNRFCKD